MQGGIFAIEKDPPTPFPIPLAVNGHIVRKWELVLVIIRQSPNQLGKMADSIPKAKTEGNPFLDIEVDPSTNSGEGEDDVEDTPKEILDMVNRHERKSLPNIDSPLEVNLGTESKLKVVFVGAMLERDLKNHSTNSKMCSLGHTRICQVLLLILWCTILPLKHESRPVK